MQDKPVTDGFGFKWIVSVSDSDFDGQKLDTQARGDLASFTRGGQIIVLCTASYLERIYAAGVNAESLIIDKAKDGLVFIPHIFNGKLTAWQTEDIGGNNRCYLLNSEKNYDEIHQMVLDNEGDLPKDTIIKVW
jgi:hypothetical protein